MGVPGRRLLLRTGSNASFFSGSPGPRSPTGKTPPPPASPPITPDAHSSASPSKRGAEARHHYHHVSPLRLATFQHSFASTTRAACHTLSLSSSTSWLISIAMFLALVVAIAWAAMSSSFMLMKLGGGDDNSVEAATIATLRGLHYPKDNNKRALPSFPERWGEKRQHRQQQQQHMDADIASGEAGGGKKGGWAGRRRGSRARKEASGDGGTKGTVGSGGKVEQEKSGEVLVSRVAFGSCTARKKWPQPIWEGAVIPSSPHAWIWLGDIAYVDWPEADCIQEPQHPQCNCTRDWLHSNRWSCLAGDLNHARAKMEQQLRHPEYIKFLEYMCPGYADAVARTPKGWPPIPEMSKCVRPILGTWDDHDYNWQDGNTRLPSKEAQKELFLDAFGEPPSSPRREPGRGLYTKHTLNKGMRGREIDVLLLDERYHRDPKPCSMRRDLCALVAIPDTRKDKHVWCIDFLEGGPSGVGSCCRKDELTQGWCQENRNQSDSAMWRCRCDPTDPAFGRSAASAGPSLTFPSPDTANNRSRHLQTEDEGKGRRRGGAAGLEESQRVEVAKMPLDTEESGMCEVLGSRQRQWLAEELENSPAPLKLLVSGSPLFNNPKPFVCSKETKKRAEVMCKCFDDFDCYGPSQVALLHAATRARGCVLVLTGDFHFSDIKVLQPGPQPYSEEYMSATLQRPIYQAMASGLTTETAQNATCEGFHKDKMGLRSGGPCNFIDGPAFGLIEVDWEAEEPRVKVQIRSLDPGRRIEVEFSLKTCT